MNDDVTRGEFDMLRSMVSDNAHRLDTIDISGTRGIGILQQQITDLSKDVAGLSMRMDKHEKEHVNSRRYLISVIIAAITAIGGLYAMLATILGSIH